MATWENIWNNITTNETIQAEYRKAFLLNILQKMCSRMDKDFEYKSHIFKLFAQSFDKSKTMSLVVEREYQYQLSEEDAIMLCTWFDAYKKKGPSRKAFSPTLKQELLRKQNGVCRSCGQPFGNDYSKIHIDHIIPWALVGDELNDNYQALCDTCNACKSARVDYMFRAMINLT
jgi:hypothetical protein